MIGRHEVARHVHPEQLFGEGICSARPWGPLLSNDLSKARYFSLLPNPPPYLGR